jgi:hypothetical protein
MYLYCGKQKIYSELEDIRAATTRRQLPITTSTLSWLHFAINAECTENGSDVSNIDNGQEQTVRFRHLKDYLSGRRNCVRPIYDPRKDIFTRCTRGKSEFTNPNPETTLIAARRYQPGVVPQGSMDGMNG